MKTTALQLQNAFNAQYAAAIASHTVKQQASELIAKLDQLNQARKAEGLEALEMPSLIRSSHNS